MILASERITATKEPWLHRMMISLRPTVWSQHSYAEMHPGFPQGREYTSFSFRFKNPLAVFSEQSSPGPDALRPQELRFETWSTVYHERNQRNNHQYDGVAMLTKKRSKVHGACSKVTLLPAPVGTGTKTSLPDRYALIAFLWISCSFYHLQWTSHVSMYLITCEWQLYPQRSLRTTLIDLSTATDFWVAKTGTN